MEYIKAETNIDEKLDWLQVVKQYCNRHPNLKLETFGLNFGYYKNNQLGELKFDYFKSCLEIDNCTKPIRHVAIFATSRGGALFYYEYTKLKRYTASLVPEHILLRLLTEGKEDLI